MSRRILRGHRGVARPVEGAALVLLTLRFRNGALRRAEMTEVAWPKATRTAWWRRSG